MLLCIVVGNSGFEVQYALIFYGYHDSLPMILLIDCRYRDQYKSTLRLFLEYRLSLETS